MDINITTRKFEITEEQKIIITKKILRLDKFFLTDAKAQVTLTLERDRKTAEITINFRGMNFRAQETTYDLLNSVDNAIDALSRQIRKNKTKLEKRLRDGAFDAENEEDESFESEQFELIKSKSFAVKPMDIDEAILQMELIGHSFYMFRNIENEDINVVYKRNGGGYGLLVPER